MRAIHMNDGQDTKTVHALEKVFGINEAGVNHDSSGTGRTYRLGRIHGELTYVVYYAAIKLGTLVIGENEDERYVLQAHTTNGMKVYPYTRNDTPLEYITAHALDALYNAYAITHRER